MKASINLRTPLKESSTIEPVWKNKSPPESAT